MPSSPRWWSPAKRLRSTESNPSVSKSAFSNETASSQILPRESYTVSSPGSINPYPQKLDYEHSSEGDVVESPEETALRIISTTNGLVTGSRNGVKQVEIRYMVGGTRAQREIGLKGSFKVVVLASVSNFTILVAKAAAALYTGSASMFSEAIHSTADLLNELLLAFGIWRSMQAPDPQHPYGFAAERYGWALVSGVGIFFLGGGVSLLHGIQGMLEGGGVLTDAYIARLILGGALVFDGGTMIYAFRAIYSSAKTAGVNVFDYIRRGADPTTVQVLFEDIGSVTGVAIAFTCLSLAEWTGDSRWDALGSFLIGCLLAAIATFLIRRNVAGIVGASMSPSRLNKVVKVLKRDAVVTSVHDVKSQSIGPEWSRFKAEINFNADEITRRYIARRQVERSEAIAAGQSPPTGSALLGPVATPVFLTVELTKAKSLKNEKELEDYLSEHARGVVDQLGMEVDRLEAQIVKEVPEVKHVDLEKHFTASQLGNGAPHFQWQKTHGTFLAAAGSSSVGYIWDRNGSVVDSFSFDGEPVTLSWSPTGHMLALLTSVGTVYLWNTVSRTIETNLRGPSWLGWDLKGERIALGGMKGNVVLMQIAPNVKRTPLLGKHAGTITGGGWGTILHQSEPTDGTKTAQEADGAILALGSDDKTFSLSNGNGETITQTTLKGEPSQMKVCFAGSPLGVSLVAHLVTQFATVRRSPGSGIKSVVSTALSMVVSKRNLFIQEIGNAKSPVELAFQQKYGDIVQYEWFGAGNILLGFSNGWVVSVTTDPSRVGTELHSSRDHRDYLAAVSVSVASGKVAVVGDGSVKIHELADLGEMSDILRMEEERGHLGAADWSPDGGFLTISTNRGVLHTFLARLPQLSSSWSSRVAHLTDLREITITDLGLGLIQGNACGPPSVVKPTNMEIELVALGPLHLAISSNSNIFCHLLDHRDGHPNVLKLSALTSLQSLSVSSRWCAALLTDGRLQVFDLDNADQEQSSRADRVFPIAGKIRLESPAAIFSSTLTQEFLVYGTESGEVAHWAFNEEWIQVNSYKHTHPVQRVYPHPSNGARFVVEDVTSTMWIVNAASGDRYHIPRSSVWGVDAISTYAFNPLAIKHGKVFELPSGKLVPVQLTSHEEPQHIEKLNEDDQFHVLRRMYLAGTLRASASPWKQLAHFSLCNLDLRVAKRIYRQLKDASSVLILERIEQAQDHLELAGHIHCFFKENNDAQRLYLLSENPGEAVELKKALRHWEQALTLAQKLKPQEITTIAKEYAQQLEFEGKFGEALRMYETALSTVTDFTGHPSKQILHQITCSAGLTRMTFRCGDIARGLKMLDGSVDIKLLRDCAGVLDNVKQYEDGAQLYERAQQWEKAAELWLKAKSADRVTEYLDKINSQKVLRQYANVKEAEGQALEAAKAFERAKDWEQAVRVYVDTLRDIDSAVRIVRNTKSQEGARIVSRFFGMVKDYKSVVEFCHAAGMDEEAFTVAQVTLITKQHNIMEFLADLVKDEGTFQLLQKITTHLEASHEFLHAGKLLMHTGEYHRALSMLLQAPPDDPVAVELAIETIGLAKDDALTAILIDYLMGDTDGVPKDAKFIFKLYMSLGQYGDAARTAIIIARDEQAQGNYRTAHDLLLDNYRQLQSVNLRIPVELERMLALLHSYVLVKILVKMEEHEKASRMLIRVANNISKFPAHVVPILTSTVVECYRSGLKRSALQFASMVMRPEYRQSVDAKYKKKIEQIVR
ncbi:WD repeat-containing protein 19 [Gonapodya sp. JEL0774]|nr:WD repeat-containing protein 19 [Gonapodya sp. JEL0774]